MASQIGSHAKTRQTHDEHDSRKQRYANFAAMIICSTLAMFAVSYVGSEKWDHIVFSQTQAYMTVLMGASMAVVMLAFMRDMLNDRRTNLVILTVCASIFALSLWLMRSQQTVDDVAFMEAMIPHHSMAILSGKRAQISDARVRSLAAGIVESQTREISQMKALLQDLRTRHK